MGFVKKKYIANEEMSVFLFLKNLHFSFKEIQRILDKNRVFQDGEVIKKGAKIMPGAVEIIEFCPIENLNLEIIAHCNIEIKEN